MNCKAELHKYKHRQQKAANKLLTAFLYDPYGIRTRVTAVKGRCLNRLTKGPIWRRRRDLNPRAGYPTYTLSRGASSAT